MSVKEYFLKFMKLSKYASSLVSNDRDEMTRYVMGVSEELKEESRAAMFHDNIDLSRLMVHGQQVEDSRLRKSNREAKKGMSFECASSKSKPDIQGKPNFKKRFSKKVPSNLSKTHNNRVSNPKDPNGRNVDPPRERPICGKCGKKYVAEYLVGTNSCYGCGECGHMVQDCPNVNIKGKGNSQA
ncbi:uncharacterized protein LOC107009757 [Solanum pennellii]|uniref:Uncharacterized protein LOC107009757 n=1 Tax=Solanum pennellii TaxID=28526 RepID=A0ABM1G1G8_SOLPN|nr:uncharacterized protein LOC107009757 [Solanum pennellii]